MNHKETIAIAKSKLNTDKENLADSIALIGFFKKVTESGDIHLIQKVHKVLGSKAVECINHWQGDSRYQSITSSWDTTGTGFFPMEDPTRQIGDKIQVGSTIGVLEDIITIDNEKIFIVRTTDGDLICGKDKQAVSITGEEFSDAWDKMKQKAKQEEEALKQLQEGYGAIIASSKYSLSDNIKLMKIYYSRFHAPSIAKIYNLLGMEMARKVEALAKERARFWRNTETIQGTPLMGDITELNSGGLAIVAKVLPQSSPVSDIFVVHTTNGHEMIATNISREDWDCWLFDEIHRDVSCDNWQYR